MIQAMYTIFTREVRDAFRDHRSLWGSLGFALFAPVLMAVLFTGIVSQEEGRSLPTVHVENADIAPYLLAALEADGYEWQAAESDLAEQVRADRIKVGLRIHPEFADDLLEGKSARLEILADHSDNSREARELSSAIQSWGSEISRLRLQLRGIDEELTLPVTVLQRDYATPARRSGQVLGGLLLFLLIVPFISGMSVAIDSLAGERERRSLEMLMVQPVRGWQVVLAKGLATTVFALMGVALMLVGSWLILPSVDLSAIGMTLQLPMDTLLIAFIVVAPICFLAASMQSLVSLLTRSYKEAQLYMSSLMLVPTFVILGLDFIDLPEGDWKMWTPMVSQSELLGDLFQGEMLSLGAVLAGSILTLTAAAALFAVGSQLIQRERVVLS